MGANADPDTTVCNALTIASFAVIQGGKYAVVPVQETWELCLNLLTVCKNFPQVGISSCTRIFRVVAAAVKRITQAPCVDMVWHKNVLQLGALWIQSFATLQAHVRHVSKHQEEDPAHAALPALFKFWLERLSGFRIWKTHDTELLLMATGIIDCVQEQLCSILDLIHEIAAGVNIIDSMCTIRKLFKN